MGASGNRQLLPPGTRGASSCNASAAISHCARELARSHEGGRGGEEGVRGKHLWNKIESYQTEFRRLD
eukprot:1427554-Pyramimonas_sp.AAC.1